MMKSCLIIFCLFGLIAHAGKPWSEHLSVKEFTDEIFIEKIDNPKCCFSLLEEEEYTPNKRLSVFSVKNESKDTIWIFFEKKVHLSTNESLYNKFFKLAPKQRTVLYLMCMDINAMWTYDPFMSLFKKLPPHSQCYIVMIDYNTDDEAKMLNFLRIVKTSELREEKRFRLYRLLRIPDDIPFWYRPNIIIFNEPLHN